MKFSNRLRKLEHAISPVLSTEEQAHRLSVFIECETMVTGQRPTGAEIEAERQRLTRPIKRIRPEEISAIAEEIKKIIVGHEARKENK